ncbi:MAG: hypothetical protein Q7T26_04940 [Dehalococcoidia bacterium]|nr:hypothetical protein [Dehalococcoidia bacterium]
MIELSPVVLAGIGGAVISGIVAVVSSAVSLRSVRQQIESQARQHEEDRRHQIVLAILQRRHTALEAIWQLLFNLEKDGKLAGPDTMAYVRNLMWLPLDLQKQCLELLNNTTSRSAGNLAAARQGLMDAAKALELR